MYPWRTHSDVFPFLLPRDFKMLFISNIVILMEQVSYFK
jgi:hypothetical protein